MYVKHVKIYKYVWPHFCTVHIQGGYDPQIQTRPRFVYNAPSPKFHHPMFTCSEIIVLTNRRRWKHQTLFATLRHWVKIIRASVNMFSTLEQSSQTHDLAKGHTCILQTSFCSVFVILPHNQAIMIVIKLESLRWFPNVVAERKSYAHVVSDAMFRQPAWLCLDFASCIMTQQNATFWGLHTQAGAMTPKFELYQDFCTMHLPIKFHHFVFTCSEVIVLTNKQTDTAKNIQRSSLCYDVG